MSKKEKKRNSKAANILSRETRNQGMAFKRQPLSEAIKQQSKLHAKYKEYSLLSLDELNELYPILGGGYRECCMAVIREKHFAKIEQDLEGEVK